MKCRIGFKINVGLLQESEGKQKEKERKNKEKETKEYETQIKVKHKNGIQNQIQFKTIFEFNSEFGCVQLSLTWEKNKRQQKATVQSYWATNGMATARNEGTTG